MDPKKIKIQIDQSKCIGIASCVALLEQVFELGDDGRAKLVGGVYLGDYEGIALEQLIEAAESCPTFAIIITYDESATIDNKKK